MYRNKLLAGTLALVFTIGLVGPVFADESSGISDTPSADVAVPFGAVTTDGQWFEFAGFGVGQPATGCFPADPAGPGCVASGGGNSVDADAPPYTFDCDAWGCFLTVQDAFNRGDVIEVFDFGSSIGTTSAVPIPANIGEQCGPGDSTDPEVCALDPLSSSGQFLLGAGSHSISFSTAQTAIGAYASYFNVVPQTAPVGGEFLSIDSAALLVAGAQTNAVWILSALAVIGSVAFGALYITSKRD